MPSDKRNKGEQPRDEQQRDSSPEQGSEAQDTNMEQDENPQRGEKWSNYRTRELAADDESTDQNVSNDQGNSQRSAGNDENFYRNRERGNYEEGQAADDDGGGGSLF